MKKIILAFIIPFSLQAQSDSIKVTFSEEKVEQFEKTTLIDEYEKAFGGNREVKSGLRLRFTNPEDGNKDGILLQYEQKIGQQFSLIGSLSGGYGSLQGLQLNPSGEVRWYYDMQKRIEQNKQKANLTGHFISFRGSHIPLGSSSQPSIRSLSSSSFSSSLAINPVFIQKTSFSLLWGKQLGNNLEFGLVGGINYGKEYFNKNINFILNSNQVLEPLDVKNVFTPYISTFSQVGVGLLFPRKSKINIDKCEFLKCNYAVNRLFKFNVNDAIYIDKYVQKVRLEAGIEKRLWNSNFTFNEYLLVGISSFKTSEIQSFKDTLIFSKEANRDFQVFLPVYSGKTINDITINLAVNSQLRYYLPSNNKVKNIKNFNGTYTGIAYRVSYNRFTEQLNPYNINRTGNFVSILNGILGYQTQTSLGSFMDFTLGLGVEQIQNRYSKETKINLSNGKFRQVHFELAIKLGLAK